MPHTLKRLGVKAVVALGLGLSAWTSVEAQSLRWLGEGVAYGVSADGSVVVGSSNGRAFRWTTTGGMQELGTLGGYSSAAYRVSADGRVVIGLSYTASGRLEVFRWENGVIEQISSQLERGSTGLENMAISADGSEVYFTIEWCYGWDYAGGCPYRDAAVFRWTRQAGAEFVDYGGVNNVSNAGLHGGLVGWTYGRNSPNWDIIIREASIYFGGSTWLRLVPSHVGEAMDVNDHLTVVGWYTTHSSERIAFYCWDIYECISLGPGVANAVSDDGLVVVGAMWNPYSRAFRWMPQTGVQDLNTVYAYLLTDGSYLIEATDISPDGRWIVGRGYNASTQRMEAFLLDTQDDVISTPQLKWFEMYSYAADISADGSVIVGSRMEKPVRWRRGVTEYLSSRGGMAYGVSADGSVVVGWIRGDSFYQQQAFRWSEHQGIQQLGTFGGRSSVALDVSLDGNVVVGWAHDSSNRRRAFRWENGVMEDLGTLGGEESMATGVSWDGRIVVGCARDVNGSVRAFRWENGVMENLSTLDNPLSVAWSVSPDGSIIVGGEAETYPGNAFLWENGVVYNLGALDYSSCTGSHGMNSTALDVSADGRVVCGRHGGYSIWDTYSDNWGCAFRWTAETGLENLNEVYAHLLRNNRIFARLYDATATSYDGRYIVGGGWTFTDLHYGQYRGYILDTWRLGDTNGDSCIDDSDLLAVLFAFGTPGTGYTRHEDTNRDGVVDDADLLVVLFNFGQGC